MSKEKIVLIGGGGHARAAVDTIESMGQYEIVGFVDPRTDTNYKSYSTIGSDDDLKRIYDQGVTNAAITVGFLGGSKLREDLYHRAKEIGFKFPPIIDPSAAVANDAVIGEGAFIGKLSVIDSNVRLGTMTIVNLATVIGHDCCLGDFSHIAVNAALCGGVKTGKFVFVGANAVVIQKVSLGDDALIGAGSVVLRDVEAGQRAVGVYA